MSKRILVVEENTAQTNSLSLALALQGYEVAVVSQDHQAQSIAEEYKPDLIVLDHLLSDLSGLEVCQRLKCEMDLRFIPIIIYSADKTVRHMVQAYQAGVDYYLLKDAQSEMVLSALIESAFKRQARRLRESNPVYQYYGCSGEGFGYGAVA